MYPNERVLDREDEDADALVAGCGAREGAGLWAPHIPRGRWLERSFLVYAQLNEEIGRSLWGQLVFGCQAPDAGNARDPVALRDGRAEGAVARAARRRRRALVLLDDRARGARLRPHDAADAGRARRRPLGDRRAQVVLVGRRGRGVRDRHGGHRPRRRAAPARDADHRSRRHPGVEVVRAIPTLGHAAAAGRPTARCATRASASRPEHPRRARRGLPDRAEAARAGADPPRHALARPDAARVRAHVLVRTRARGLRRPARRQADGAELDRRLRRRDPGVPAA